MLTYRSLLGMEDGPFNGLKECCDAAVLSVLLGVPGSMAPMLGLSTSCISPT